MSKFSVIAGLAVVCLASASRAQDAIPGGWSARFEYQSLGMMSGEVANPFPIVTGQMAPEIPPGYVPARQPVRALGFLGSTIRRTTRPRRGR